MNDLRKYSREFIAEFIDLYKSLPAVWKIKSRDYSNRDLKTQAYDVLVEKWKEVEPSADRDFVVKKINSMRTVYRREVKKVSNNFSGMGSDELESSSLWYFDLLSFLRDQEVPRSSSSSMENENTQQSTQEMQSTQEIQQEKEKIDTPVSSPMPPPSPTPSITPVISRPKKRPANIGDSLLTKISKQLDEPLPKLDRFDFTAKAWAETLRSLPDQQRLFAERIINDVFFEAQSNTLTRESHLQVQNSPILNETIQIIPEQHTQFLNTDNSTVLSYINNFKP